MTKKEALEILRYYSKYLKGINGYDNPKEKEFIACAIDNLIENENNDNGFSMTPYLRRGNSSDIREHIEPYKLRIDNDNYKYNNYKYENNDFSITIKGCQE